MTQLGYWRDFAPTNQRSVLQGWGSVNQVWYVFPNGSGPGAGVGQSYTSLNDIKSNLRPRDVVIIGGVLREQVVLPTTAYDILFLGAANTPRQATDGGVATGGGATWMAPTSPTATTPLVEVTRQGCQFMNIAFNPHTASAAIRLTTSGGLNEAGQAKISGCTFIGGGTTQIGIEDNGGAGFVVIEGNIFDSLGNTAILGLTTANAVPRRWQILNNSFGLNLNDIKMSLSHATIQNNNFTTAGSGATNKVVSTVHLSGQGLNNHVVLNFFHNSAATVQISNGYSGAATDMWANYVIGTAALSITSPPGA